MACEVLTSGEDAARTVNGFCSNMGAIFDQPEPFVTFREGRFRDMRNYSQHQSARRKRIFELAPRTERVGLRRQRPEPINTIAHHRAAAKLAFIVRSVFH